MAGQQWCKTECIWKGGVSEPATLQTESNRAAYQIIIFGELFASTVQAYLEPKKNIPKFDLDACRSCSGLEALNVGGPPYDIISRTAGDGPDFVKKWKQKLWFEAVQMHGLYPVEKLDNGDESLKHIIGTRLWAPVSATVPDGLSPLMGSSLMRAQRWGYMYMYSVLPGNQTAFDGLGFGKVQAGRRVLTSRESGSRT
ncbi:hypothetical protein DFH05DRAFT_1459919 [Lentinula detonsa]|uniref:Uncharacterized protein n=1 Tax=Lentinula detonsa TaxID=2804962 RepID=A0A9W8P1C6_9AGAR|nr:hypothetical protein DFH05DRAFT_1459919 [Lentinula detonsa]